MFSWSVLSDSLQSQELWPARLLYPWISQVGMLEWVALCSLAGPSWPRDRIRLPYWQVYSLPLHRLGSPSRILEKVKFSVSAVQLYQVQGVNWKGLGFWASFGPQVKSALQCKEHWFNPWLRKIPHVAGAAKPMRYNDWACVQGPESWNDWAHAPQLLKLKWLESVLCSKRSCRSERPEDHN